MSDEAEAPELVTADVAEEDSIEEADELAGRFLPTQAPSVKAITKVRAIVSTYVMRERFFIAQIIQPRAVVYHAISPLRRYRETGKADERQPSQNNHTYASISALASNAGFFFARRLAKRLSVHASHGFVRRMYGRFR